jgi:hypothetical protein
VKDRKLLCTIRDVLIWAGVILFFGAFFIKLTHYQFGLGFMSFLIGGAIELHLQREEQCDMTIGGTSANTPGLVMAACNALPVAPR